MARGEYARAARRNLQQPFQRELVSFQPEFSAQFRELFRRDIHKFLRPNPRSNQPAFSEKPACGRPPKGRCRASQKLFHPHKLCGKEFRHE